MTAFNHLLGTTTKVEAKLNQGDAETGSGTVARGVGGVKYVCEEEAYMRSAQPTAANEIPVNVAEHSPINWNDTLTSTVDVGTSKVSSPTASL
jgi:hypothetical protein